MGQDIIEGKVQLFSSGNRNETWSHTESKSLFLSLFSKYYVSSRLVIFKELSSISAYIKEQLQHFCFS